MLRVLPLAPLVFCAAGAASGCLCFTFDLTRQASLDADDPVLKIPAIVDAAEPDGLYELKKLIDALEHRDEAVRLFAIEALKARTGSDLGFRPHDPPEERAEAVSRWRRWLAEQAATEARSTPPGKREPHALS